MGELSHEANNPFVFSDGTDVDDSNFMYKWSQDEPYDDSFNYKCSIIYNDGTDELINSENCGESAHGLCKTYEKCNSVNSESEQSRANFPVFALFMACSVFKTFYALVGSVF